MAISFRSSNPTLNPQTFQAAGSLSSGEVMTLDGTVNKTGFLVICVVATAAVTWHMALDPERAAAAMGLTVLGGIGGFIIALVTVFKKVWAPVTAPVYALLEGLLLGGVSAQFNQAYRGIAIQAVSLTIATLVCMLLAYRAGLIRATEKFKLGIFAATGGIAALYLVTLVLGFFGIRIPQIYDAGPIGIAFSLFVVVIAALNLVLDFDMIETGAASGAPKYMEWYGAFGLMVTLIWLYFEILRLLAKLNRRR
jgi:uncharacterized YccA/Bax inhibitor family protein